MISSLTLDVYLEICAFLLIYTYIHIVIAYTFSTRRVLVEA